MNRNKDIYITLQNKPIKTRPEENSREINTKTRYTKMTRMIRIETTIRDPKKKRRS